MVDALWENGKVWRIWVQLGRIAADADINGMLLGPGRHEKCEEGGG